MTKWIAAAVVLLGGGVAPAQTFSGIEGIGTANAVGQLGDEGFEVILEVVTPAGGPSVAVAPGGETVIAVVLQHAEKWHTNPNQPVVPPEMEGFVPIPTTVVVGGAAGVEIGSVQYPEPHAVPVDFFFTGQPIDYLVYEGRAVSYVPVRIAADATPGESLDLAIEVTWQACDDQVCLAPQTERRSVRVDVVADAGGSLRTDGDFAGFDASIFAADFPVASDGSGGGGDKPLDQPLDQAMTDGSGGGADRPIENAGELTTVSFLGFLSFDAGGIGGFVVLALVAALGGAILNLTPCVLPVIPIKVMTLSQHAGESRSKALALGGAMALGVIAFWFVLGIPAAAFTSFADPSRVFGYWFVTAPLGALMVLLAMGLMGLFALNLPKAAYMVNPKADNLSGSFLFGVMTGVLGLPCFGFVAGALIPAATTLGTTAVIVIFTALGVGMAAPYLVLSIFPKLVEKLPRTGPASELVKQVLGLLLIGFGLFFFGTGIRALVATHPYVADVLHLYGLSLAVLAAGSWLLWRTLRITRKPLNVAAFGLIAVVVVLSGVSVSLNSTLKARESWVARQRATEAAGPGTILTGFWNSYSPALLDEALGQGKVAFIDFTADWCINCKVFEAQVLDREPTKSLLADEGVAMIKVDLTGSNAVGEKLLSDLGRVGIPTWAVMGPGLSEPMVLSGFTAGAVRAALEAAAGDAIAAAE